MAPKPKPEPTAPAIRKGLSDPTQWKGPIAKPPRNNAALPVELPAHPGHGSAARTVAEYVGLAVKP